jgi:hypothetical protein
MLPQKLDILKLLFGPKPEEPVVAQASFVYSKQSENCRCDGRPCNCQLSRVQRPNALSPIKTSNPNSCYELQTTSQSYDADTDSLKFIKLNNFFQLKNDFVKDFDTPFDFIGKNFGSYSGNPSPNPNINTKISITNQGSFLKDKPAGFNEALWVNIDKEIINNIINSWKIVSNKGQSKESDQEGLSAISDDERKKIAIYILIAKSFDGMSSLKKRVQVKAFIEYLNKKEITPNLKLSCDEAFGFSYQFQQHSLRSGFMTGRQNPTNYVAMRLKRIPEVIISKFLVNKCTIPKNRKKVIDDYNQLRESFYDRLSSFQPDRIIR